ncbi:pyrokinin-1 receptor-like [Ruditapes philippinarum]|uniref:pyrokinin-1 receptor-like n=1 Tax=Ruditapes philippinarum TaxID=129788 RepID=UPI00295ACDD2|nr:pyrokinin-1 receptor-like [Ruditapes philippinarum]
MEYLKLENITYIHLETTTLNITSTDFDVEAFVEEMMGEKRRDITSVAFLTFFYVLIFITGISGNICTCIVITRNTYMHTATNYYLLSLAISDMLTLIFGLPTELYGIWESYPWRFGEPLCIFKSFLAEMTSYASILTITAFTVERYVAICHPLKAQTLSNLSRAVKMVISIWILSCLFALPYPIHTRVFPYVSYNGTGIEDSLQCNIPFKWQRGMTYAFQISTFVFFVFPMGLITVMYGLIGNKLRSPQLETKHKSKTKARKAVVRMLFAVVVAFFVQWAPFHAQRLITLYVPVEMWTPTLIKFQSDLFYVSGVLYFCNSTINPILYNLMSKKFRLAFKRTLCRCCYTSEELLELNGKSKSIYCSDRTAVNSIRKNANNITKLSFMDLNGTKNVHGLLNTDKLRDITFKNGRRPHTCPCYQSHSSGRLNELYSDTDRIHVDHCQGFGPRAAGLRYQNSTNSSLVSFCELESDSIVEMKSLSTCSSSNLLNTKILSAPLYNLASRQASFV